MTIRDTVRAGLAALVLLGTVLGTAIAPAGAEDEVSLALDWIVNGTHAGYFAAQDKGAYRDEGLKVTIGRGFGSGDTVKRVGTKAVTFGVADTGAMLAGRSREQIPVKAVYMVYGQAALGLLYLEESGIKAPKDLEGRKLARSAGGASVVMFPGFVAANHLDRSKLEEVVVDGATFLPLLLARRVDAVLEQSLHQGRFQAQAKKQGLTVRAMRFADYGLVAYGNTVIVHDDTLKERGDLIRRFLRATDKGLKWAFGHKDEAIGIIRKNNPEVDLEWGVEELAGLEALAWSPEAKRSGLGWIDRDKMAATIETVTTALKLPRKLGVEDAYTTAFQPGKTE
ncbi:MAG: ABC transporter substrate-binding protein [Candidatus Rokubacteria bacterium]|nr:ABC transporter substrate-binding protein [Candidatus Rokubacteria bacterium]